MTVRAWFTISALVVVALAAAFVFRLFAPQAAPEILARVGEVRLQSERLTSCWPQRNGDLKCERGSAEPSASRVPQRGTVRLVVAYPVQPESGRISISGDNLDRPIVINEWRRRVPYELEPGVYDLFVDAKYPADAELSYLFRFTVTRSGS